MNQFDEILKVLNLHKQKVDVIIAKYRRVCQEKQEKFSESYYKIECAKVLGESRSDFKAAQYNTRQSVNEIIEIIQGNLEEWVQKPVQKSSLDLLVTLDTMGISLTESELEALADSMPNNYFAGRIIEHLAKKNKINTFQKFSRVGLDGYISALKEVVGASEFFIRNYLGQTAPFPYELFDDSNRPTTNTLVSSAAGCSVLRGGSLLYAAVLWDGSIPNSNKKYELTEADKASLNRLYDGCNTDDDFSHMTKKILHEAPHLREMLVLSPQYSKYL